MDFPPIPKEAAAGGRCQSCAARCPCATAFPPPPAFWQEIYGRVDVCWYVDGIITSIIWQAGGVIATPASCFQGGVLCVYPQATIKTSREPRFNHRRRSPSNRNALFQTRLLRYQKSGPKQHRLITEAWGSRWPDCDPCNYSLYRSCASSSCPRQLWGQ